MMKRRDLLTAFPVVAGSVALACHPAASAFAATPERKPLVYSLHCTAPDFPVPPRSCDCHVHVFDSARFPFAAERVYTPDEAPLAALRAHLAQLHMQRVVLVQPSPYGTDNRCLLDALHSLGTDRARGVAVVETGLTRERLDQLHHAGVRGLRVNLETYGKADPAVVGQRLQAIAGQIAGRGWNLQMYTDLATVQALAGTLATLPVPVVLDHFSSLHAAAGPAQPGLPEVLRLLADGKVYVKLSALYRVSTAPDYADVQPYLETLMATRLDHLIWGSDWPHTMPAPGTHRTREGIEYFRQEDDGRALNLLARWVGDPVRLKAILVDNPGRLFWG